MKSKSLRKVKAGEGDNTCMPNINLDEWSETRIRGTSYGNRTSSVHASSTHSLNRTSRFLSRLRRFTSSRSSRPCPVSSPSFSIFDNHDDASGSGLPCCNMQRNSSYGIGARDELDVNLFSSRIQAETDTIETRHIDRRNRVREPVDHNVRFSRTLSVGRLRDRVLRRSTFSDLTSFPLQQERELRDDSQNTRRQAVERDSRVSPLDLSAISSSTSSMSNSIFSNQNYEVETSQLRDGGYQDLMEHRSNFLERGRRIRSQARSLQRLSSRFENQSAHGRSCILSGQHRSGHCMCRFRNRDTNSNDDTGARASISRIVVLAEALFEVTLKMLNVSMNVNNTFVQYESFVHILIRFWMKSTSNLWFYLPILPRLLLDAFLHLSTSWSLCLSSFTRSCINIKKMLHSKYFSLPSLSV